jgi:hypothetical protein
MKRHLMTLILSGFVGSLVLAGSAEACHMNRCHRSTTCCEVVTPPPCPPPAPICQPTCAPRHRLCGGGLCGGGLFRGFRLGCHKRACAPAHCPTPCATVAYTGTYTGVWSSPQTSAQH